MTLWDAWSDAELAAYRRGELPEPQLAKVLAQNRKSFIVVGVLCGAFLGGLGGAFGAVVAPSLGWIVLGVVCGFVIAIPVVALLIATISGPFRDRPTAVVALTGVLELEVVGFKPQRRIYSIAGERVEALYRGFDEMVGRQVTLYTVPDSRMVIAAEPPL